MNVRNHMDVCAESLPFILEVVKKTDRPQVGFIFNYVAYQTRAFDRLTMLTPEYL
jgi:hypothetical protein